ncbi:uncharacterized protein BP01DRAFT_368720 [Aspergillus saccharolyticus JOP 1030-1]|uniref:Survival Motor Neuron Gemin2-binding domain-containing protein n=1 Tax=Aspergillus saccharolyticus JOP 1030-1 TaxID=1450539 RepID=A0A318Z426_9EURO|nr:hypothetical protein BP01DRAFT_368720 [Aspergillus saccharolyticus JOP 1030-1]PYH41836.1 hypothetical protein BP01DRAFT_368720 [Aspergillus saccharolyticus JOP 1030-1]
MGKSKNTSKPLTQEEIWDDSALVQSWDEAVEEYKLYHSIQAGREDIDEVLREAEAAENPQDTPLKQNLDEVVDHMDHDAEPSVIDAAPAEAKLVADSQQDSTLDTSNTSHTSAASEPTMKPCGTGFNPEGAVPTPHAALAQVQDKCLKNLMMAWYYAGYYTGLYEGQQRTKQNYDS